MPASIRVSGVYKAISKIYVRVAGVWKEVQNAYVRVGGVWKKFHESITVSIANQSVSAINILPDPAVAAYRLENDGDVATVENGFYVDVGDWINPKSEAGANYEARMTTVSGSLSLGVSDPAGSWLSLATTRTWAVQQTTNGTSSFLGTMEIRRAADGVVLDSASISLEASASN